MDIDGPYGKLSHLYTIVVYNTVVLYFAILLLIHMYYSHIHTALYYLYTIFLIICIYFNILRPYTAILHSYTAIRCYCTYVIHILVYWWYARQLWASVLPARRLKRLQLRVPGQAAQGQRRSAAYVRVRYELEVRWHWAFIFWWVMLVAFCRGCPAAVSVADHELDCEDGYDG